MSEISISDPRLKPASKGEIEQALRLLCNSMRAPEGGDFEALFRAYIVALDGCPAWAVANAVRRFVQGKVPDQSLVFCPYPPGLRQAVDREMAPVVRQVEAEVRQSKLKAEARAYRSTVQRTPEARQRVATAMDGRRIPVDLRGPSASGSRGTSISMPITIDARDANAPALARVNEQLKEMQRSLPKQIDNRINTRDVRGTRP